MPSERIAPSIVKWKCNFQTGIERHVNDVETAFSKYFLLLVFPR